MRKDRSGGRSLVVEHLHSLHTALVSPPPLPYPPPRPKPEVVVEPIVPALEGVGQEG